MSKKGFSLVEIMVVIVIMGILAAVAVPQVFGMVERTHRGIDATNAREIRNILVRAYDSHELEFPQSTQNDGNGKNVNTTVAVVVYKDKMEYRASGTVQVNGGDWSSDKGKAYDRIRKLLAEAGFDKVSVQAKNPKDGGWSSYGVLMSADGTCKFFSSEEDINLGGTSGGSYESAISKASGSGSSNIELFMGANK